MGTLSDKMERDFLSEQEILSNISDVIMTVYGAESAMLRVEKLESLKGEKEVALNKDMFDVYKLTTLPATSINLRRMPLTPFVSGEEQSIMLDRIDLFTKVRPVNIKESRRQIADKLIDENKYCF
ncbi:MAG: hypothetical protein R2764_24895 [Bacteroidales bacterium]